MGGARRDHLALNKWDKDGSKEPEGVASGGWVVVSKCLRICVGDVCECVNSGETFGWNGEDCKILKIILRM